MKKSDKYRVLFGKYLTGNCTDEEKAIVKNWLKQSPDNQTVYEEYKQVWKFSALNNIADSVDVNEGWDELNKRIKTIEAISAEFQNSKYILSRKLVLTWVRIAAVVLFAVGFFFLFNTLKSEKPTENLNFTATESLDTPFVLADGSEVFLDAGATINYPEVFGNGKRVIHFEGNAFFNIAHNPDKPFIILSGELQIEVLGTSFNLSNCPDGEQIFLCLESGKVRFSSINIMDGSIREQIILTPGQKGIFNKNTGLISRSEINNKNYMAWKTGILVFEKTPLDEVICALEQTYNLNIVSEKSFENLSLTARFNDETPENIFESLHTIFGISYSIDGKTVFLN